MRVSRRSRLVLLAAALTVCLLVLAARLRPRTAAPLVAAPPLRAAPPLSVSPPVSAVFTRLWARRVYDFQAIALSPDADFFALLSGRNRRVSLAGIDGKTRWSRDAPEARQVAVTNGGQFVLTWAVLDPTQKSVRIRQGEDGALRGERALDGAIWSGDIAADGLSAAWATGNRTLARVTLGAQPAFHDWKLAGIGNGLALSSDGATLAAGTWDDSGVSCWTPQGVALWTYPNDPTGRAAAQARQFEAQISGDGRYVLGLSYENARQRDGTLFLWLRNGDGTPLWTVPLGPETFSPRALISSDASIIAVTYNRQIMRDGGSVTERQLRLFNRAGTVIGKSGGLLFAPTLLALSADGTRVTVSDGQKTLYHLDNSGRFLPAKRAVLPGQIRQWAASRDGKFLLVYTGDGTLSLLRLE